MRMKGNNEGSKRRDEPQYQQLILEIPPHRPPPRTRPEREDERDRGVVTIELY